MMEFIDNSKIKNDDGRTLIAFRAEKGPEPLQKRVVSPVNGLFAYKIDKVLGESCPNKFLISINNRVVCFVNSKNGAKPILDYAYSRNKAILKNGKIRKIIDEILGGVNNV